MFDLLCGEDVNTGVGCLQGFRQQLHLFKCVLTLKKGIVKILVVVVINGTLTIGALLDLFSARKASTRLQP